VPTQAPNPPRSLPALVLAGAGGLALGIVLVMLVDGVAAAFGLGRFGDGSGFLAAFPAVFVFYEEYQRRPRPGLAVLCSVLAAVVGAGAGIALGAVLPPIASGGVGAAVAVVLWAALWYAGNRHLEGSL
jgi:hypothetical protein